MSIDPLFNKFEPLQKTNPELVARLEQVVEKGHMNIPPERMYLMKASEKVSTMNAYVTGFGNSKRVVVWDTSLQKGTPDEVLFIFGHESGHYVLNHIEMEFFLDLRGICSFALSRLPLCAVGNPPLRFALGSLQPERLGRPRRPSAGLLALQPRW